MPIRPAIIPCLAYTDAPAAIDFLGRAFGFARHAVYADDADPSVVHHAQLTLGDQMVMLSSVRAGGNMALYRWKTPEQAGGVTMSIYVTVDDVDGHAARAEAAGAALVLPPHDNEGYPGRGYSARDPEGNMWSFGSYDPWSA